ncbi:aminodeoxychorismate synthase component I [Verrucomicrobiota bacterium]
MNSKIVIWNKTRGTAWRLFKDPVKILSANRPQDVLPTLNAVRKAVEEKHLHAAGFLAYEAAPGLEKACTTHDLQNFPLVWFGLFDGVEDVKESDTCEVAPFQLGKWEPSVSLKEYRQAVARIKSYQASGDTYQVNFTFRMRAQFEGDPESLFLGLHKSQRAEYCAFIDTDDFSICSASPELFFSFDGSRLISRPMKGTSRRGLTLARDNELAATLYNSEKNRAENVMIVDMVRNDMGRIADPGSVHVSSLYDIERYPTVLQMTSTVACKTSAFFPGITKALFPCASITGAPKIRTMQIIKELEKTPRGIYTGCIGWLAPDGNSEFNVAIRTVSLDKKRGIAEYGVGGGIVWDSDADNEYEECLVKAAVLTAERPNFKLLETILWEKKKGYFLLDRHLERLKQSAEYFGFDVDIDKIRKRLMQLTINHGDAGTPGYKVRVTVDEKGESSIEAKSLDGDLSDRAWIVVLAEKPIDLSSPFLYHKTTNRSVYEHARSSKPDCDDILLWNEHGEITESTIANIVIEKAGKHITPPIKCGLLPGVFRGLLLERGEIEEGIITAEDVRDAEKIYLVNSVRKWIPAVMQ